MSFKKKLRSELIEILVFSILAIATGTWMTASHSLRDLDTLIHAQSDTVDDLQHMRRFLLQSAPDSPNLRDIDAQLAIEVARYNAHVTYYNQHIEGKIYKQLASALPTEKKEPLTLSPPLKASIEVLISD